MKHCTRQDTPRWERRKEDRPQEILCAAVQVFGEKGFACAKLEEVAKKAGVSKGTVYLYYPNKEELLKSVVREYVSPIVNTVRAEQSQQQNQSCAAQIEHAIWQWWQKYGSTELSAITKLILNESASFPELGRFFYEEVIRAWWIYLQEILDKGVKSGEFSPIDTEYAAKVLCSPLVTLAVWKRSMDVCCDTHTDPQRYIKAHVQWCFMGCNPKHPPNRNHTARFGRIWPYPRQTPAKAPHGL
ncbi:MAG: TetR/AcrR family transcriptional regulator [Limnobacter sp.]|nr:TetR/AcrR family transcriptional regulator [Limnobacter sp.]